MIKRKTVLERQLNEKQILFCRAFVGLEEAHCFEKPIESYIYAGYSEKTANVNGYNMIRKPAIREYITILREEIKADNLFVHKFNLKDELVKIATSQEEKTSDRLRAFELIGKMQGAFVNKTEVTTKNENPLADVSTDDLKEIIGNVVPMTKAQ